MSKSKEIDSVEKNELSLNLANRINESIEKIEYHKSRAIEYAIILGGDLKEAKKQSPELSFVELLKSYCPSLQKSQAYSYIKLHDNSDSAMLNGQSAKRLSVATAISYLAATGAAKKKIEEKIDSGEVLTVKEINAIKKRLKEEVSVEMEKDLNERVSEIENDFNKSSSDKDDKIMALKNKVALFEEDGNGIAIDVNNALNVLKNASLKIKMNSSFNSSALTGLMKEVDEFRF